MSQWPSTSAKRILAALLRIGWQAKRQTGLHKILMREGWSNVVFPFHERNHWAKDVEPDS